MLIDKRKDAQDMKGAPNMLDTPTYWNEYPDRDIEFVRWYPCKLGALSEQDIWRRRNMVYYIHIPFCNNVCACCPYNKFNTQGPLAEKYLEALKQEISNYASRPYVQDSQFISGYIGGGTPTSFSTKQLDSLLKHMKDKLNIKQGVDNTIETTPVDIDEEKAAMLLQNGVNRISIGVQSFDDGLLKVIGRTYSGEKVQNVIKMLRKAGFKHICADLMLGLPGQTMKQWLDSVDKLIELKVESLSLYIYLVLPSSSIFLKIQNGIVPPCPNKEVLDEMFNESVKRFMSAGYFAVTTNDFGKDFKDGNKWEGSGVKVYDISPDGYKGLIVSTFPPTAHLSHTWYECGDMLAMGSGAYGYMRDHMYLNEPNVNDYIEKIMRGELPIVMGTHVSPRERMARSLILGMKLLKVDRQDFVKKHGIDMTVVYGDVIKDLEEKGLVRLTEDALEVTYPKGWYYVDNISKAFYTEDNYRLPQPAPTSTKILKWLKK